MSAISVALCTRNGARYVEAQVRSICEQDLQPVQLVVSDDGSSDGTPERVERTLADCGATGIALTVLRNQKPLGVTRNFEQALRHCEGDLIALCDQDDVWHAGRLSRMAAMFDARPDLLLLHTDARMVDGALAPLGYTLFEALEVQPWELAAIAQGRAFDVFLRRNLVTGATTLLRRSLLDVALPFDDEWVHDEWLAVLAAATGRVDVLREPTIDYRQHGANQIGAKPPSFADKLRKAMDLRGDKHWQRARRAQALLDRLESLGPRVPDAIVELQRGKLAHQQMRARLPASRLARLLPIVREARTGRYDRFGRGKQAIVQDLMERG